MNDTTVHAQARRWMDEDPDAETRAEVQALLDAGDDAGLEDRFGSALTFGTAGLRGVVGAGPNRMNRVVVLRTSAGLARYLKRTVPGAAERGVVVGCDARRGSPEFKADVARALAAEGVRALVFERPVPTPVVAFTVRRQQARGTERRHATKLRHVRLHVTAVVGVHDDRAERRDHVAGDGPAVGMGAQDEVPRGVTGGVEHREVHAQRRGEAPVTVVTGHGHRDDAVQPPRRLGVRRQRNAVARDDRLRGADVIAVVVRGQRRNETVPRGDARVDVREELGLRVGVRRRRLHEHEITLAHEVAVGLRRRRQRRRTKREALHPGGDVGVRAAVHAVTVHVPRCTVKTVLGHVPRAGRRGRDAPRPRLRGRLPIRTGRPAPRRDPRDDAPGTQLPFCILRPSTQKPSRWR